MIGIADAWMKLCDELQECNKQECIKYIEIIVESLNEMLEALKEDK